MSRFESKLLETETEIWPKEQRSNDGSMVVRFSYVGLSNDVNQFELIISAPFNPGCLNELESMSTHILDQIEKYIDTLSLSHSENQITLELPKILETERDRLMMMNEFIESFNLVLDRYPRTLLILQGKPSLLDYPGDETKYQSSEINKGEEKELPTPKYSENKNTMKIDVGCLCIFIFFAVVIVIGLAHQERENSRQKLQRKDARSWRINEIETLSDAESRRIAEIEKARDAYLSRLKKEKESQAVVPPPPLASEVLEENQVDPSSDKRNVRIYDARKEREFISKACSPFVVGSGNFYMCKNAIEVWLTPPFDRYPLDLFKQCPKVNSYQLANCIEMRTPIKLIQEEELKQRRMPVRQIQEEMINRSGPLKPSPKDINPRRYKF